MKFLLAALLIGSVAGCASAPAGPTLPEKLTFKLNDYTDNGGVLPITGRLELTIEPTGEAVSACRRDILTDVERAGSLTREQLVELVSRVEAWAAKGGDAPPPGNNHGFISYGAKKTGWSKDASLLPELQKLVDFLVTVPPTLSPKQRRKGF
jgi:hypothetical protein